MELPRFPPPQKVTDYPLITGIVVDIVAVVILLIIIKRFDASGGPLTIALVIVVAFLGLTIFVVTFTIPPSDETATVIGGLATAFGAVVAFWLRRKD